jgi:hypothetical protein
MKDVIYYIFKDDEIVSDLPFSTEQEARDYAEEFNVEDFEIRPWQVD